ncbi:hypothetical protein BKA82DRAFT_3415934 [Pisolithus tinctorius]|nr:hypothetical protein BKA82DRAFT_3415934 [Pisolithus tinctorius]
MNQSSLLREYCARASASGYSIDLSGQIIRNWRGGPLRGSTAIVYRGTMIPNGTEVAIKTFHTAMSGTEAELKRLFREVHTWSKLHHENIVPLFGISTEFDSTISIISEWMPMGDAHTYVQNTANDPRPLGVELRVCRLFSHHLTYSFSFKTSQTDCTIFIVMS